MSKLKSHIFPFLVFLSTCLSAQTQVEVITKTVSKKVAVASGTSISIQGQGARMQIRGTESNEIELTLKLISKGLIKAEAEKELEYQRYVVDELNGTIVIRNYLLLPKNVELKTIQETVMEISVPNTSDLSISNSFGTISLQSFEGKLDINSEYSDVSIKNFEGDLKIEENFGDLKIEGLKGSFNANLDHTELELIELSGSATISSNLGGISVVNPGTLSGFRANCQKTDISISLSDLSAYHWDVRSKYGVIDVPLELVNMDMDDKENHLLVGSERQPRIRLTADFGNVKIEKK